jgi:hypothetical protein
MLYKKIWNRRRETWSGAESVAALCHSFKGVHLMVGAFLFSETV